MRANEAKKVIDSKIANIEKTVALFYGKKHYKTIKERMDKVLYYVYDSDLQEERIMQIELLAIAKSFAYDVIDGLDIDKIKKAQLQDKLARIIMDGATFANSDLNKFVKNEVEAIDLFNEDKDKYYSRLLEAIDHYLKDFEVKGWLYRINSANELKDEMEAKILNLKKYLLKKYYGAKSIANDNIEKVWALTALFNPLIEDYIKDSLFYRQKINQQRNLFYQYLGYDEKEKSKFNNDKKFISKLYHDFEEEYNREFNRLIDKIISVTNLDEIFSDLESRSYTVNKENVINLIFSTKLLLGINIKCINDIKKPDSFILYPNLLSLYSEEFDDTCMHEIIHYLGGFSSKFDKKGLHYESNILYLELEEAYANYIAKAVSHNYVSQYGHIMEIQSSTTFDDNMNRSLEYMDRVFKYYKEEILQVHLSEDISLDRAKELFPIEQIAIAVYKINNADSQSESKEITKKEINKLVRGSKR